MYVAAVSPARDTEASYVAWGHSTVVGPWGDVSVTPGSDSCGCFLYAIVFGWALITKTNIQPEHDVVGTGWSGRGVSP